jgi:hypothetical protein
MGSLVSLSQASTSAVGSSSGKQSRALSCRNPEGWDRRQQGYHLIITVGSKLLTTAFFIIKVHGNYSVILGHDWIHANHCVPSTLHQFLIRWIDNEIKVVHTDALAYIALANAMANWQDGGVQCLSGKGLIGYDFLSVSKDGFVPVSVKPAFEARLGNVVFQ